MRNIQEKTEVEISKDFYNVVNRTPLNYTQIISQRFNNHVYLKREDTQPVHSFKLRGAYHRMLHLEYEQLQAGVIAASAGNHAQGVAMAAKLLNCSCLIVMPTTTPKIKVDAVERLGAEIVLYGESFSDAYEHSKKLVLDNSRTFIHPFDDPLVIKGQSTIGDEIIEQLPNADYIFVPVGGGGLAAGVVQAIKFNNHHASVIGVEPISSNAMTQSIAAGYPVRLKTVGAFADGVAVKQVGDLTFDIVSQHIAGMVNVTDQQVCKAIERVFENDRTVLEPAGALALAGLEQFAKDHNIQDANMVAICTGANLTFDSLANVASMLR